MSLSTRNCICSSKNFGKVMFIMEINSFFTIILMLAAYGLPQTCFNYCKDLTNQFKILRPECNCTTFNRSLLSNDSRITREPLKLNLLQNIREKSFHSTDPEGHIHIQESISKRRTFDPAENNLNNIHKSHKNYINGSKHVVGYPLYLDIDLSTSSTKNGATTNFKEDLKHLFEKVRASENNVSECTDLHIYIFSKNNDNINKTHTNWGHRVKHDNLAGSEVLTEILNKCDQLATIIHESMYVVKPRKHVKSADNNSLYDTEKYKIIQDDLSLTTTTHETQSIATNIDNNNGLETVRVPTSVTESVKEHRSGAELQTDYASIARDQSTEIYFNKTRLMTNTDLKKSVSYKGLRRGEYNEKDLLIPKIITKEHANNTISSAVAGFETMPNLDFVNNNTVSSQDQAPHIDQSSLVQDVKENLHISFDNNPIPARFIVNSEGEMHLAVDGFALCDRMSQKLQDKRLYMKLFCECIKFHNC